MRELAYVRTALELAATMPDGGEDAPQRLRRRARNFVQALAMAFRHAPDTVANRRVLSKHSNAHRAEFGLNELLYDILVCEVAQTVSPRNAKALPFLSRVHWQIECEFAKNAREAIYDFNKLVLGCAPYKLFIGPQTYDDAKFLDALLPSALSCTGTVFAALVTHPSQWGEEVTARFWQVDGGGWLPVAAGQPDAV